MIKHSSLISLLLFISMLHAIAQPSNMLASDLKGDTNIIKAGPLYKFDFPEIMKCDSVSFTGFSDLLKIKDSPYYNFHPDSIPKYNDSVYYERIEMLNKKSPISFRYNESVRAMIDLYLYKHGIISRALSRKDLYFPLYEEMLDKYSIPQELKYLSIIESALNPTAKSHAHAVGLWQFISSTGRMYGLHKSYTVDDRMNPYKATEAACQHFIDLYEIYGNWDLVLAAYNAGPGNVNRAIRRAGGSTDYWEVRKYLPRETQAYVPAFIAVNYLMNYHQAHNIHSKEIGISYYDTDTLIVNNKINFSQLSDWLKISFDIIQKLNPQYKRNYIPSSDDGSVLCLPVNVIGEFILNKELILSGLSREEYEQQAEVLE